MSGEVLEPCPFCGASVAHMDQSWLDRRYSEAEVFNVQCQQCCACGPSVDTAHEAAEAWGNVSDLRAEIARLRAQLRAADTRTQAALDDRADAEARGYRKGAAACLADVARLETEAEAVVDAAAPCSDFLRGHRHGAYRMARRIRQRHEVEAAGRYRPPTEAQIARDEADKAEAEGADR